MTTNSTKLSNTIPNSVRFLVELTKLQKEEILSLQEYNWRIAAAYSLDENLMRITRITISGKPAKYRFKQLDKLSKITFLSLVRKEALVLESDEKKFNSYYLRVYKPNGENEF